MDPRPQPQISLTTMLLLVASIAVNLWLFRVSVFWGLVAINVTKHVAIAALCQFAGVNRRLTNEERGMPAATGRVAADPVSN